MTASINTTLQQHRASDERSKLVRATPRSRAVGTLRRARPTVYSYRLSLQLALYPFKCFALLPGLFPYKYKSSHIITAVVPVMLSTVRACCTHAI